MEHPYIVGITGGSASGKTLLLNSLFKSFESNQICLISQDNYYKPIHQQPMDEEGIQNFDTPFSINFEDYYQDIVALRSGQAVQRKEYTFNNPAATHRLLTFRSAPIIILEGIFVFYDPKILAMIDLKVFVDAEEHIKLKRRIVRDKVERGYDLEDVLYRYEKHVVPTYEKFIKPYKHEADIIIPNNRHFEKGLSVLIAFLKTKIESAQ